MHQPVLKWASRLVTLNEDARSLFVGLNVGGRVVTIPNFVADRDIVASNRTGWLAAGRLTAEKGIDRLARQFPDNEELRIAGDGPLKGEISALAASRQNVTYLGVLSHNDLLDELDRSRGFVLPSLWSEGVPTVAIEALAAGTPVLVSTFCKSASELTRDRAGLIYDPDGGDLATAVETIEKGWSDFHKRAVALHQDVFSPPVWLRHMTRLYAELALHSGGDA